MIPAATPGPLQLQLTQQGCPGQAVTAVSRTRAQLRTRDTHARLFPCSAYLYTVLSKLLQCEIASLLMGSLQGQLRRRRPRPRPRTSTVQHQATRRSTGHARLTLRLAPGRAASSGPGAANSTPTAPFLNGHLKCGVRGRVSDNHSHSHMSARRQE